MSQVCSICATKAQVGHTRSHSNIATLRRFKVNLQVARIKGKRVRICANCKKTMSKVAA